MKTKKNYEKPSCVEYRIEANDALLQGVGSETGGEAGSGTPDP